MNKIRQNKPIKHTHRAVRISRLKTKVGSDDGSNDAPLVMEEGSEAQLTPQLLPLQLILASSLLLLVMMFLSSSLLLLLLVVLVLLLSTLLLLL